MLTISFPLPADPEALDAALEGLASVDAVLLHRGTFPRLYDSGVVYRREAPRDETWWTVDHVLLNGWGDCEDLACWRAAELRVYDAIPARPHVIWTGPRLLHVVVLYPDGTLEDPSKVLGMTERQRNHR